MISKELEEKLVNAVFNYDKEYLSNGTCKQDRNNKSPIAYRYETEIVDMLDYDDIFIIVRQLNFISCEENNFVETLDDVRYCVFMYDKDTNELHGKDLLYEESWFVKSKESMDIIKDLHMGE